MKIVFLTNNNHPGTLGGIQTFNRILKNFFPEEMITITNKNNQNKVYSINNLIEIGTTGILYKIINKLSKRKLEYYLKRREIKKIKPDVCILSAPSELRILKKIKCKKILVQHNKFSIYLKNYYQNNKNLIEMTKKELDFFVFLSKYDLIKFHEEIKYPLEKSKIIRHTSEMKNIRRLKEKNKNLIMLGRIFNEHKRYDLAILAMKKLKDFNLFIYGDGIDLNSLKQLVYREKIKNVFFKGATTKVSEVLDMASIFIITSEYEGYPLTAIEAIKRGLPIVLRNTFEAAQDIIENNKNGILLSKEWNEDEFIDAIKRIYNNYDQYSQNTTLISNKYNLEIIKEKWKALIINCI